MQLTQFGMVLMPLCLIFCMAPLRLLQLTFIAAVFGAAAGLVIGDLGLPPGIPPATLFIFFIVLQYALGARYPGERQVWRLFEPFAVVVVYAIVSGVVLPRVFKGAFNVWPQKVEFLYAFPVPLGPTGSNYTQGLYLLSNTATMLLSALYLTRSNVNFAPLVRAYFAGAAVVCFICLWQVLNRTTGLAYPETFLYSNPGWVIFPAQELGGVPRTNGPFSEPAGLAAYLSGVVFSTTWVLLRGHRSRFVTLLLPASVVMLFMSTSTTGYATFVIGAALMGLYGLLHAPPKVAARLFVWGVPLVALAGLAFVVAVNMQPKLGAAAGEVLTETLGKSKSESYDTRTSMDTDSLWVPFQSYGLGAGFGSVRASSLGPGLLANLGMVGVLPLIWFGLRLMRRTMQARAFTLVADRQLAIDAFSGHMVGQLVAAGLSSPMIASIDFFLCLGVLMACVARIELDRETRPTPRGAP